MNRRAMSDHFLHSTGYPVGLSKIAPEYRDAFWAMLGCGQNLDSPDWILTGGVFWAGLCQDAIPKILPRDFCVPLNPANPRPPRRVSLWSIEP